MTAPRSASPSTPVQRSPRSRGRTHRAAGPSRTPTAGEERCHQRRAASASAAGSRSGRAAGRSATMKTNAALRQDPAGRLSHERQRGGSPLLAPRLAPARAPVEIVVLARNRTIVSTTMARSRSFPTRKPTRKCAPHRAERHVEDVVEGGADAGEGAGREPEEGRDGHQRHLLAERRPSGRAAPPPPRRDHRPLRVRRQETLEQVRAGRAGPARVAESLQQLAEPRQAAAGRSGTAASRVSNVSALARNGTWFSSASSRVRQMNPQSDRCQPCARSRSGDRLLVLGLGFAPAGRASASRRSSSSRAERPRTAGTSRRRRLVLGLVRHGVGRRADVDASSFTLLDRVLHRPHGPVVLATRVRRACLPPLLQPFPASRPSRRRVSSPLAGANSRASPAPSAAPSTNHPTGGAIAAPRCDTAFATSTHGGAPHSPASGSSAAAPAFASMA